MELGDKPTDLEAEEKRVDSGMSRKNQITMLLKGRGG